MKAILIIDMPEDCSWCPLLDDNIGYCKLTIEYPNWKNKGRPKWCPLKEVKDGTQQD